MRIHRTLARTMLAVLAISFATAGCSAATSTPAQPPVSLVSSEPVGPRWGYDLIPGGERVVERLWYDAESGQLTAPTPLPALDPDDPWVQACDGEVRRCRLSDGTCSGPELLEPPEFDAVLLVFDGEVDCDQAWSVFATTADGWFPVYRRRGRCISRYGGRDPSHDFPAVPYFRRPIAPQAARRLVVAWSSPSQRAMGVDEYSVDPIRGVLIAPVLPDPVTLFVPLEPSLADKRAKLVQKGNVVLEMVLDERALPGASALPDRAVQELFLPLDAFTEVDGGFELEVRVPAGYTWFGWVEIRRPKRSRKRGKSPPIYAPLYGLRGEASDGRLNMALDDSRAFGRFGHVVGASDGRYWGLFGVPSPTDAFDQHGLIERSGAEADVCRRKDRRWCLGTVQTGDADAIAALEAQIPRLVEPALPIMQDYPLRLLLRLVGEDGRVSEGRFATASAGRFPVSAGRYEAYWVREAGTWRAPAGCVEVVDDLEARGVE